jgi:hypothetical protein
LAVAVLLLRQVVILYFLQLPQLAVAKLAENLILLVDQVDQVVVVLP